MYQQHLVIKGQNSKSTLAVPVLSLFLLPIQFTCCRKGMVSLGLRSAVASVLLLHLLLPPSIYILSEDDLGEW